ncbi:Sensor histidine kinase ResE [bioreactor metagenome]|uniref:histidine kinase n=1 Tax=bioreactor metagenome TaxID=1076179 RepID=A0A645GVP4_9ZZZZ
MIDGIWEPTKERLESLNEEILRLTRMLSGLDKIAEIENNDIGLNRTYFDIFEFTNKLVLNFEFYIREKNITLNVEGSSLRIYADKDKIGQVIINLISNAIKYTNINGEISISILDKGNEVEFSITDNGAGIEKEDLPYIFERLYRADKSRSGNTGGNGMGLAVVKAIVDGHNGKITVKSESEFGSKFTVTLPK